MLRILIASSLLTLSLNATSQGNNSQAPGKQKGQAQQAKQYAPGQEKSAGESAKSYTPGGQHGKNGPMPMGKDMHDNKSKQVKGK